MLLVCAKTFLNILTTAKFSLTNLLTSLHVFHTNKTPQHQFQYQVHMFGIQQEVYEERCIGSKHKKFLTFTKLKTINRALIGCVP